MTIRTLFLFSLFGCIAFIVQAEEKERDIYSGKIQDRVDALAAIQPGLGVVMHEVGYRFTDLYLAANGGNWGLAQYELKELIEALEVGEATRPKRANMLQAFEQTYLDSLGKAITKKNIEQFNGRYTAAINGCNACHTALGYNFLHYQTPTRPMRKMLDYTLKTEPQYDEEKEK